jgi:hypothetical protein
MRTGWVILIGIITLVLLFFGFYLFGNYSKGSRAGTVVKMSERGVVFKTWEGQLNLGGISGDTGSPASSLWDFSVSSGEKEVLKALEAASLSGTRLKLYYHEKFVQFDFRGDTKYFIYQVETPEGKLID